jgi:ubiquitin C-terminal hydrolase
MNSEHMREERGFNWGLFLTINGEGQSRTTSADAIDLTDCLKFMTSPEVLSEDNKWHCDRCNSHVQAVKSFSIWRDPPILILHLARFVQIGAVQRKLDVPITYPDVLDFVPFLARPSDTAALYRLFGVVEHYGTLSAGHYVAICWVEDRQKWLCFNDSGVRPALSAGSPRAYILFYRRVGDTDTVE